MTHLRKAVLTGCLLIAYLTGGKTLPRKIADQIVHRTDGVPLFIEELTKTVMESGIVTDAGDHYCVTGPVTPLAIPTTLHASLLARLDRLAPTREVAQIGATLGRSFSHELISAVAYLPQQKLDEALEQLASAELIFRRRTPPRRRIHFQARLGAGCRLRHVAPEQPSAASCSYRRCARKQISGDHDGESRGSRAALYRCGVGLTGHSLLVEGRTGCSTAINSD